MEKTIAVQTTAVEDGEMIIIRQLPIIEQQLAAVKEQFEQAATEAREMECTEETRQAVKARRAELTKIFNELENRRKAVKKAILAPYEAFEKVYKECITDIYKPCDAELAAKIAEVENGLKAEKIKDAAEFFAESCTAAGIDFLDLESVGLTIGLNTSKKSIHESITAFVQKTQDDLALIDTQENSAEILVEYKKTLNSAQAITTVVNRHKAMQEEQERLAAKRAAEEERARAAERVVEIAAEEIAPPVVEETPAPEETLAAPTAEATVEEQEQPQPKIYEVSFTVRGTIEQIKALKAFLTDGGYDYEQ